MCICTTPYSDSKWSQSGSFSYVTRTSVLSESVCPISEHSPCRLQLEMDMPERNAFKLGNKEVLSCITHACVECNTIYCWLLNKHARCWCCNVHSVLAYQTRPVSQNQASSLDRQHFCASLNLSMNAPARVRCAKTRSARRLSALWDTAEEKCRA